jgi:hypothetical protein
MIWFKWIFGNFPFVFFFWNKTTEGKCLDKKTKKRLGKGAVSKFRSHEYGYNIWRPEMEWKSINYNKSNVPSPIVNFITTWYHIK